MSQPYTLPRDSSESSRLDEQHKVYIANIGYLLHPHIVASLPKDARIGDIGTGTGAWLLDLAREQHGSWQYSGLDMSSEQFPKQHPQNVSFATLNMLEPIPEEHRGKYDALHLRLLVCGLAGKDWHAAASNLLTMLKPGGWLQWEEGDFQNMQALQNAPGASTSGCRQILDAALGLNALRGRMLAEPRELASIVTKAKFEDVREDVFSSDRDARTREAFNRIEMLAVESTAKSILREEGGKVGRWSIEGLENILEQGKAEIEGGKVYHRVDLHVVIARRPQ